MAAWTRIFFIVILVSEVIYAKEYLCKDPDTGKHHPVNTTWSSTTFCGNYTCKLKNIDDMETHASTIDNIITEVPKTTEELKVTEAIKAADENNKDRFLTEEEIKALSELLHMVKKSDLDAVVEIYNLAKEIYEEMDSTPKLKSSVNNAPSYWYDPLQNYKPKDVQPAGTETQTYGYYNQYPYKYPYYYHYYQNCPWRQLQAKRTEQPSTLLPYPFSYVNRYNYTYPYFYSNMNYKPTQPPNLAEKAVLVNPELNADVKDISQIEDKSLESKESPLLQKLLATEKLAPWQTAPLSDSVLEEVRANILESSDKLLMPLRKLRLERVAKVLKLDELTRKKREEKEVVEVPADEEVVLEKTVCQLGTEPGLFRVGNLTAPYPHCCPQKIDNVN